MEIRSRERVLWPGSRGANTGVDNVGLSLQPRGHDGGLRVRDMSEGIGNRRPALHGRWRWPRVLAALCVAGVVALGTVLGWLKWHENELVFETAVSRTQVSDHIPDGAERMTIRSGSGAALAAVILRADPSRDSGFWVLHLHGNADSAFSSQQLKHVQRLASFGLNVLSFDYRGFGLSPGVASEAHMNEDAEAAYAELRRRGVGAERIIVWGHSLGSGPAVDLAAKHAAAALVLFGAFTSIPDAAADTYPYLPVRRLAGVHFESLSLISRLHLPVLIAHSVGDTVIPYHHAQRLYAAAREPKRFLALGAPYTDGFGGHVDGLYDHLDLLIPPLAALVGQRL